MNYIPILLISKIFYTIYFGKVFYFKKFTYLLDLYINNIIIYYIIIFYYFNYYFFYIFKKPKFLIVNSFSYFLKFDLLYLA